jgi:hypothetical protein
VPRAFGTVESNGVYIADTNHGSWLGEILLSEQIQGPPVQSSMDFDEIGNRLFLITNKGLTVVQLTSPPLSVGYLNPAFGSIAGGTTVSIRGRDSNRAQLSASAGLGQRQHSSMEARSKLSRPRSSPGETRVSIRNPDGTSYSLDAGFVYQEQRVRCANFAWGGLLTSKSRITFLGKGGRLRPPRMLERLLEPSLQELSQLGCRLELWDGIQLLECGRERIRKTPDRSRRNSAVDE